MENILPYAPLALLIVMIGYAVGLTIGYIIGVYVGKKGTKND